jgi:hypothetical protein
MGRGMGAWWGSAAVRVTHTPTGTVTTVNEGRSPPSQHRMCVAALRMLRGKLWTMKGDQHALPIIRTYIIPDGEKTTHELETGKSIDETARSYAAHARSLDRRAED